MFPLLNLDTLAQNTPNTDGTLHEPIEWKIRNEKWKSRKVVSCQSIYLRIQVYTCLLCNIVRSSLTSLVRKNLHPNENVM